MPQDFCRLKECFYFSVSLFQCGHYKNPSHGSSKFIIISTSTKTREKGWPQCSETTKSKGTGLMLVYRTAS